MLHRYSIREILLNDNVVRCRGVREELEHWQRVTALHKDYYFLPERFVIPPLSSVTNAVAAQDIPHTPKATKVIASLASTPSTYSSTSSSTTSSPAKSSEDASVRFKPIRPLLPLLILYASINHDFVIRPVCAPATSRKTHSEYM